MCKFCALLFICFTALSVEAQTANNSIPATMPYGKIGKEDLEMKACDFEKDANAEILFDKGNVSLNYNLIFTRHLRIKIFNDNGKNEANIRLPFIDKYNIEKIIDLEAETINLNNGNIEFTKIDKKLLYNKRVDKNRSEIIFTFPNVQPGSVIELKYTFVSVLINDFPDWYFQKSIPTRYSEIETNIPDIYYFKNLEMTSHPYVINQPNLKAMAFIPSLNDEPFMTSKEDNMDKILFKFTSVSTGGLHREFSSSWEKIGKEELDNDGFGDQLDRGLAGEGIIIKKAKAMALTQERIEYIFNEVKTSMKWNDYDVSYTNDGTAEAWKKKVGNSTEINLILYHLLHEAGVPVLPMLVSTKSNGKVNPAFPNPYQFNRAVVYVPINNDFYVLDATSKYNVYNEIPEVLLNGMAFYMDKENAKYDVVFLQKTEPVVQMINVNAVIQPDGKITGTARINSQSYNRINTIKKYKTDGEKKYIEDLTDKDNGLKISSVKFENMETDTLPLVQHINFGAEPGVDGSYIYVNPNLLTPFRKNPFITEKRLTNIDFGYRNSYVISCAYKLPPGYKIDGLPKSTAMTMPDNTISFKRIVSEDNGSILIRYFIVYKKSVYFKEEYPDLHEFYKKMYEMLNEQIVLKKA